MVKVIKLPVSEKNKERKTDFTQSMKKVKSYTKRSEKKTQPKINDGTITINLNIIT